MLQTPEAIFAAALALSEASRARLADLLWASLPDEELELPLDEDVRRSWAGEARRRMQQVADGTSELLPGDEVMERVRTRYA